MSKKALRLDEIGYWSELKLEIIKKYASAYSTILANQPLIKAHLYIDAFAGAGTHVSRTTGDIVAGSPVNAMGITPPFTELHFIDLDGTRTTELRRLAVDDRRVTVHDGDCNQVLLAHVFRAAVTITIVARSVCSIHTNSMSIGKCSVLRGKCAALRCSTTS